MIVNFPDKVWGRLASIADNRDVSIADLIVEAAQGILNTPRLEPKCELEHVRPNSHVKGRRPTVDWQDEVIVARIHELYTLGRSLTETAREFGVGRGAVRTAYVHLGLPITNRKTNPKEGN